MPGTERLYVIGDIHGRADLLERMIDLIARDLQAAPARNSLTVTIGDYIDRGPDSRGVLERLPANPFPGDFIALKGNHEALLAQFLHEPAAAEHWRRLGGLETLHSYGVDVGPLMHGRNYRQTAEALAAALPAAHRDFLASLKTCWTEGGYFLCHAGVRPGVPLPRQREHDLLWMRDPFLGSAADFGKIVVHGHTPVEEPEIRANRINIDTGAFMTGRLSCAVLQAGHVRLLTAT
jgi:serine/threonine protein phosphatase 1